MITHQGKLMTKEGQGDTQSPQAVPSYCEFPRSPLTRAASPRPVHPGFPFTVHPRRVAAPRSPNPLLAAAALLPYFPAPVRGL